MNKITLLLITITVVIMTGCAFPFGHIGWAKQTKEPTEVTPEVVKAKSKSQKSVGLSNIPAFEPIVKTITVPPPQSDKKK